MAIVYTTNLVIYTGTDFEHSFTLENDQSNSPLNLTGYTASAQLRKYETSSSATNFTVTFANDRTTGTITLSIGSTESASIRPGKYLYDLVITSPSNIKTRVIEGVALVKKSVTRL